MTGTTLKLIALVLMTVDHIGEFIPGRPHFLRLVGRLSAPVFIFCAVQGAVHTKDSGKRLKNLYLCSVAMGIMDFVLNTVFQSRGLVCDNNIFTSIFIISLLIHIWEGRDTPRPRAGVQDSGYLSPAEAERNIKRRRNTALILAVLLPVVLRGLSYYIELFMRPLPVYNIADRVIPNIITCEGGIAVVLMGLVFYFCKNSKSATRTGYLIYCTVFLAMTIQELASGGILNIIPLSRRLFVYSYQWLQVLALPIIICYNNKRGKGLKHLFYIYYPVHILILFISGSFISL